MPDWFPTDAVAAWLSAWGHEIVFSVVLGILAAIVTFLFGEYGKGE